MVRTEFSTRKDYLERWSLIIRNISVELSKNYDKKSIRKTSLVVESYAMTEDFAERFIFFANFPSSQLLLIS